MPWCFQCGIEYAPNVADCLECGVALVDAAPVDAGAVGTSDEEQLAYELHEWAGEARRILDQLLRILYKLGLRFLARACRGVEVQSLGRGDDG